jgi:predicted lactoylglutathione lyase
MRMIFVNLPVRNAKASTAFFEALGFKKNAQFSDDNTASIVIDQTIVLMLLEDARFRDFLPEGRSIADTSKTVEVLNCLSCESREEVDALQGKAIAAGGKPWMPAQDHGFMYGTSFVDLDGHVWELVWMNPANVEPY